MLAILISAVFFVWNRLVNRRAISRTTAVAMTNISLFFRLRFSSLFLPSNRLTGVTIVSIAANTRSTKRARIQAGMAPARIITLLTVLIPENTRYPSPPPPT